jgi:hypothetical protein
MGQLTVHVSRQLENALFNVSVNGELATREDILGEWSPLDRFGIIAHEPYGPLGGSHLLQLAITAWYDVRPARRELGEQLYPEIYVFHVGGRWGEHAYFDVYPPRKEVFVDNDPKLVLEAINDRAITHLAVPDRPLGKVQHGYKEPRQARDRITRVWAYDPGGRTRDADVTIASSSPRAEANTKMTLQPDASYTEQQEARAILGEILIPEDEIVAAYGERQDEVSEEDRDRAQARRDALKGPDGRVESYRTISVDDAVRMLHIGADPPRREAVPEQMKAVLAGE